MPPDLTGDSVVILGMRVDPLTPKQAVDRIVDSLGGGRVLTPNLQHLHAHHRSARVRGAFDQCELVLADGMPLVWASRLLGTPLPARVAGSDLVWSLSEAAARRQQTLFLLGGSPGTAAEAAAELRRRYAGLRVVGTYCPPLGFERSADKLAEIRQRVGEARPDLIYIGLPLAKQLIVMEVLRETVPAAWQLGLGASFSFVTGDVRRAPRWMQRTGFEWLFRLSQEPRRLGRRYLVEGLPFFTYLMLDASRRRLGAEFAAMRASSPDS
jgi:N-acetylglucosaminyldiphosphoundecaprenol N-acetyl-beta-D-mannosaminyltransferase